MKGLYSMGAAVAAMGLLIGSASAATVTGDPSVDSGWVFGGHSMAQGTYVQGEATFSFDIYSASFTVAAGSSLEISDGNHSWLAGDQILGLGGKFVNTTVQDTGWGSITWSPYSGGGTAFNDDVSGSSRPSAKFGTETSVFTASTTQPLFGNGQGSMSGGHGGDGAILTRITSNRSSGGAGQIGLLDLIQRYNAAGSIVLTSATTPDFLKASRLAYTWSTEFDTGGHIGSWQILLNTSLLDREFSYATLPAGGDLAIQTVQRGTNRFTDGLITTIPEPASLGLLALGLLGLMRRRA